MSPIEEKLHDALEHLRTRDDFVTFVELLLASYREPGARWENTTVEAFLSGLVHAARELEACYESDAEAKRNVASPNWEAVAGMLFTARCVK